MASSPWWISPALDLLWGVGFGFLVWVAVGITWPDRQKIAFHLAVVAFALAMMIQRPIDLKVVNCIPAQVSVNGR